MRALWRLLLVAVAVAVAGAASAQERQRGWLGAEFRDLSKADAGRLGWTAPRGAKVVRSLEGSPASAAGLAPGDVIATLDGTAVESMQALLAALESKQARTVVKLGVITGGSPEKTVSVTLGPLPYLAKLDPMTIHPSMIDPRRLDDKKA